MFCVCLAIGREEAVNCSSSQCPSTHQTKLRKQKKSLRCQHRSHKSYGTGSFLTMAGMPRTRISCGFHLYPGQEAAHSDLQTELCVSSGSKDFMFGAVVTWDFQVGCTEEMSSWRPKGRPTSIISKYLHFFQPYANKTVITDSSKVRFVTWFLLAEFWLEHLMADLT